MRIPEKIKSRLVNRIAGINVHYTANDQYLISCVSLKQEKGKVGIVSTQNEITDIKDIGKHVESDTPVWISVTGRPVISRKLDTDPGKNYLHNILPNAKAKDFSVSILQFTNNQVYVSAIRQENIDKLTAGIQQAGLYLLGYSVGPAAVEAVFRYNLTANDSIAIPAYRIISEKGNLKEILPEGTASGKKYSIQNEEFSNDLILPFATAFNYLVNHTEYDTILSDNFRTDEESYLFRQINKYMITGSLALVFILLILNFLFFNHYRHREQTLSDRLAFQESFFTRRDSIRNEIEMKTRLVEKMGLSQNTRHGFLADRIAATIPKGITLNELTINPVSGKIKADKPIQFRQFIKIAGESKSSLQLNDWVHSLEQYDWIRDIEIIDYQRIENKGHFEIHIKY